MVYLATFGRFFMVNVGKYTIHGSNGIGIHCFVFFFERWFPLVNRHSQSECNGFFNRIFSTLLGKVLDMTE